MLKRAVEFAAKVHQKQVRKGTDIPYFAHPCNVGVLLSREGCQEEIIITGILHDTVEDSEEVTPDVIRQEFGEQIAAIVAGCSEPDKSLSWRERKQHTIDYLKTAPEAVLFVAAADKLDNIRSIAGDYASHGDALWQRFNAGKVDQHWYYQELANCLTQSSIGNRELVRQFAATVNEVFD